MLMLASIKIIFLFCKGEGIKTRQVLEKLNVLLNVGFFKGVLRFAFF